MTNEMKINKCGCGGEVTLHTDSEFHHYRDFYYCECDNCSNRSSKYDDKEYTIQQWNTAHPEISPAMQAVKWLEEGHKVTPINGGFYLIKRENSYVACWDIQTGTLVDNSIHAFTLFDYDWELYEEPKYKEASFIYAMTQYLNKAKVTAYFKDEEIEYTLQENDENGIGLSNAIKNESKCLTTETINNAVWRIYD